MLHRNSTTQVMLDRMMECSEEQVTEVARFGDGHQKQLACRVLESPRNFRHWESTHSQLLRNIVSAPTTGHQVRAVRRMALAMIHRKTPFEYLRDKQVRGAARHRFFDLIYGPRDFAKSVVNEHRHYLEASASYLCVERFCAGSSMRTIADYEQRYGSYWNARTASQLVEPQTGQRAPPADVLRYLHQDLQKRRVKVLYAAPNRADALTIEELRRPTGDTVRLIYREP